MKKFFTLFALVAFALTSCDNGNNEVATPQLNIGKLSVEFTAQGGTEQISLKVVNPVAGEQVAVESSADWFEVTIAEGNTAISVTAKENIGAAREASFTLSYATAQPKTISVKQAEAGVAYDVVYEPLRFEGYYFGTEYSSNYNYYVALSDIAVKSNFTPKANGTYYYFDFYSNKPGSATQPLPNGTYTFDANDTFAHLTFSASASYFITTDGVNKESVVKIKSGTVTVTDGKFDAVIELENGETHRVVYEGDLTVDLDYVNSTLAQDFTFNFEGASIKATNLGIYEMNKYRWYIEAVKGDELFMLDVFTASADSPAGIYTKLSTGAMEDYNNKFMPGLLTEQGLIGAWYTQLVNNVIKGYVMAPITDGLIQIAIDGNNATITYSATDDGGAKIEGSISGGYTQEIAEE